MKFLTVLLFVSLSAKADFIPPLPESGDQLDFKIMTVGLGTQLHSRYGHTALRVIDRKHQLDYVANWGIFDPSDPISFGVKFYLGDTVYRLGFSTFASTIKYYQNTERRPVWQHELNLSSAQKLQLLAKIRKDAQPENLNYQYQYFLKNCVTIPRDHLNDIFADKMKLVFSRKKVDRTFRDYVFSHLSYNPFVGFGLDILFSSFNDQPMTAWEEMFYPLKFVEHLESFPAHDDQLNELVDKKLLSHKLTLVNIAEPPFPSTNPYFYFLAFFVPLLITPFLLKEATIFLSIAAIGWGLIAGFFGFTHIFVWLFSSHFTAYHNVNLFLFWPVDFAFLWFGFKSTLARIKGKHLAPSRFLLLLSLAHLAGCALYLVLWLLDAFDQNVDRVLAFVLPVFILYYVGVIKFSKIDQSL